MYLKISCIVIILHCFFLEFAFSQTDYSISYIHTKDKITFKEIAEKNKGEFLNYEKGKIYFKPNETYWIKLVINKQIKLKEVILLFNTPISKIECFTYDLNDNLKYFEAGIYSKYKKQIIQSGDKNKIYINFQVKENTIYLKISNELLFKYNLDKIEIRPLNEWILSKERQHLFQGFVAGIIIVLVLISLLYKISSASFINYYYIAYILSNLVFFLFLNEYTAQIIFNSSPQIDLCLMTSMHFASIFFIQFARHFFQTKKSLPTVDRITNNYFKISLIASFCLLVTAYFNFAIYSYYAVILEVFNQFIGLMIIFFAFRKTDIIGKLIIIGSYISSFGVVFNLYNNHIVDLTTQNTEIIQVGYIIEILFMLIAINIRYRQFENQKQNALLKNIVLENENKIKVQENLLLKKEKDISQLKTQLLENEINTKDKALAIHTMQLTQKDLLLSNLNEKIKKIHPETTGIQKKELNEIIQNLNTHQKDTFWKEFEVYFEQMHNGFFSKLSEKYPDLTQSEKRLCAFLKVGMTSKEIGTVTHKNFKSIEVFRSRLRKKIDIQANESLNDYLNRL